MKLSLVRKYGFLTLFLFQSFILSAQQTKEQWIEDINHYHKTLEALHINMYSKISKDEFSSELEDLKTRLAVLTDFEVKLELMRLTHKIGAGEGDGHTAVPLYGELIHKFPIKLFDFENELRVIAVSETYKDLLQKRLIRINDIPIREIYKRVSEITPYTENKQSSMDRTTRYMMISEILYAFHITDEVASASFTFLNENNEEEKVVLKPVTSKTFDSMNFHFLDFSMPVIDVPEDPKFEKLWFSSFHNSKTVYVKFGSYPSEEDMNAFGEEVFNFIQENKSKSLIIDLRDNYGGDFFKGQILVSWLNLADSINWKDNVYVLVNRKTYSAAMVNAVQIKQILNAKVVGEPTGANPNGYQDMGQFTLPNSQLNVTYSKRFFRFQDAHTNGLQPDVLITPKWTHYKNRFDEVLNWVLNDINK